MPNDVIYRGKMGFSVPMAEWTRGPLRDDVSRMLIDGPLADSNLFNTAQIDRILSQHFQRTRDYSDCIWSLLMFDKFLRRFSPQVA